jgi:hypothetical protein
LFLVVISKSTARGPTTPGDRPSCFSIAQINDQARFGVIGTNRALLEGSLSLASLVRNRLSNRSMNISASIS